MDGVIRSEPGIKCNLLRIALLAVIFIAGVLMNVAAQGPVPCTPPAYSIVDGNCTMIAGLIIVMDKPVSCSSIATDGTDFRLYKADDPGGTIIKAEGIDCVNGYTTRILITFSNRMPAAFFTIFSRKGTDGNSLVGMCGDEQVTDQALNFLHWEPIIIKEMPDTAICFGKKLILDPEIFYGLDNIVRWQPAIYFSQPMYVHQEISPSPDTAIILTVTDFRDLCPVSDTFRIKVLRPFDLLNEDTVICKGDSVRLRLSGDLRYNFTWTPGTDITGTVPGQVVFPKETGKYTLQASYPGCTANPQSVTITVRSVPEVRVGADTTICYGDKLYMSPVLSGNISVSDQYQWSPATAFNDPFSLKPAFTGNATTKTILKVTTADGCHAIDSGMVTVFTTPKVNAGNDATILSGSQVTLHGKISNQDAGFYWTPAAFVSDDTVLDPIASLSSSQLFYLTATTGNHCIAKDSVLVTVIKNISIPNAFSPNNDGINDRWEIPGLTAYPKATIDIFNRWGQAVYRSNGYSISWDGTMQGKKLPAGTYYYMIDLKNDRIRSPFQGSVTLIR